MRALSEERNTKNLATLSLAFCVIYIALFCWLGLYAWPQMDDYAFASYVERWGFWQLQKIIYTGWTGRVTYTFLIPLLSLLPLETTYWIFPTITVLLYAAAVFSLVTALLMGQPLERRCLWALLVTSVTLAFLPNLNEILYWRAGMPYFWSAALLILELSLAIRALRGGRAALWLCCGLLVVSGTLLELPPVFQGVTAFCAALFFLWRGDRRRAGVAGIFWLVSVAAFLVMFLAPGTAIRMGSWAKASFLSHLVRTLAVVCVFGFFTLLKFFVKPVVYVFLLFLPGIARNVAPFDERLASRARAWHIVLATIFPALLAQAIAGWSQGTGLALRAESLALWMMGAVWGLAWALGCRREGTLARIRASRLYPWRWALLALCLLVSFNFTDLIADLRTAPRYFEENRQRAASLLEQRDAGAEDIVVPLLTVHPNLLFFRDMGLGVGAVSVLPRALCGDASALERLRRGDVEPLERIAEEGGKELQFAMGVMYDLAPMSGAAKDAAKARHWYLKAARKGDAQAQRSLARLCLSEDRSPRGYLRAFYWLARSQLSLLRL